MSTNTDGSTVGPPDADEPSLRRRRGLLVAVVITVGLMAGAIGRRGAPES